MVKVKKFVPSCVICGKTIKDYAITLDTVWSLDLEEAYLCENPNCALEYLEEQCGTVHIDEIEAYVCGECDTVHYNEDEAKECCKWE
ncbi:MAG: hypothetical protein ACXQTR_00250 [Candidatus Methanospirareceae archaeon]